MSEPPALPPDPLSGSTLAAYWSYGYDMPDDLGGGFVTGELLLRADGVLLRRQTLYFPTGGGKLSPGRICRIGTFLFLSPSAKTLKPHG